jgi:hypothetical protein
MDKIGAFARGVRFLLPGISVAVIFYLFTDASFDEFFFLVFCVIFVGVVTIVVDAVVGASKAIRWLCRPVTATPPDPPDAKRRLALELCVALVLGFALVAVYESDLLYRAAGALDFGKGVFSKYSSRDPLALVLGEMRGRDFRLIDRRPVPLKLCPNGPKDCANGVYAVVRGKDDVDIYEGSITIFPSRGEFTGVYLSPACVKRRIASDEYEPLARVAGPGIYLNARNLVSIELLDVATSECFRKYYPNWKPS